MQKNTWWWWSHSVYPLLQLVHTWRMEKSSPAEHRRKKVIWKRKTTTKIEMNDLIHSMVQAVIYLISPAHNSHCLHTHTHLFSYCRTELCVFAFLFAMRNGIRSKSIFRCSFHSSALNNFEHSTSRNLCPFTLCAHRSHFVRFFSTSFILSLLKIDVERREKKIIFMTCFPCRFIEFAKIKFEFIYSQWQLLGRRNIKRTS